MTASRPADGPSDRDRDRDPAGRPRNARPRDELGRPLPPGAGGVEPWPEEARVDELSPAEALGLAQELLDAGRPFAAHEVLEARWRAAPAADRDLWRALAQLAVGATHAARGNRVGAVRLLRRGASTLATLDRHSDRALGLETVDLAERAMRLVDDVAAGEGPVPITLRLWSG